MTHSSIATLNHLLASDLNLAKPAAIRFLNTQFNLRNSEVLEYFFNLIASDHKYIDYYFDKEFFEMVLRSRWTEAQNKLAHQLLDSPHYLLKALNVLALNDEVLTTTVNTIIEGLVTTPKSAAQELRVLEILALAAIENNKPELYNQVYQRAVEIDSGVKPFVLQHGRFCDRAVESGAWWAVKSIIADGAESYVFYKAFEDASEFAPVSVLDDLYETFTHLFTVEFSGRATEYLCKREATPEVFELIAKIVLMHPQLKMNGPSTLWPLCRTFVGQPQFSNDAWHMLDFVWNAYAEKLGGIGPYFLVSNVLSNPNDVQDNSEILRHISVNNPESYATIFEINPKFKSRLSPQIVDALLFSINASTDQLLVKSEYETEKLNIFRQKMLLTHATANPQKSIAKRKI